VRLAVALALLAAGCDASLPEPDAAGAVVMRQRCSGCHRIYAPGSMTLEMWKMQITRMRAEFARRGHPWLSPGEERALLDYLESHAGA